MPICTSWWIISVLLIVPLVQFNLVPVEIFVVAGKYQCREMIDANSREDLKLVGEPAKGALRVVIARLLSLAGLVLGCCGVEPTEPTSLARQMLRRQLVRVPCAPRWRRPLRRQRPPHERHRQGLSDRVLLGPQGWWSCLLHLPNTDEQIKGREVQPLLRRGQDYWK